MVFVNRVQKYVQSKPTVYKIVIQLKKNVYQDESVLNGNVDGYINSSIGSDKEANVK